MEEEDWEEEEAAAAERAGTSILCRRAEEVLLWLRRWVEMEEVVVLEGERGRLEGPPRLWRVLVRLWLWRLEGREAEDLRVRVDVVVVEAVAAVTVVVVPGKASGFTLVVTVGDWIATGIRLGVFWAAGEDRGEAKLAGSRGARLGEPAWEMRNGGRVALGIVGVPPVNL